VATNVYQAKDPLQQRGTSLPFVGDERELMGLDAIPARLHTADERLIVTVRAADALPVERPPDDHRQQTRHVASQRPELMQDRLDVETHGLPAQAVRGRPRVELGKACGGLAGIAA